MYYSEIHGVWTISKSPGVTKFVRLVRLFLAMGVRGVSDTNAEKRSSSGTPSGNWRGVLYDNIKMETRHVVFGHWN
jgi:hypothetical protein